jgi:excinuclease ABC subunit A
MDAWVETIRIRGARQHNLRNIDVDVPKGRLVVITGPSGCGKSSLAFHTLFAEGRRRFVESLSAHVRHHLEQLERPDVDSIDGLSPAIAIEQRAGGLNPRSTVATATEIHDSLRVLWAAVGVPHDPATGARLRRMTPEDIVHELSGLDEGTRIVLLAPVPRAELDDPERLLGDLHRQGFVRIRIDGSMIEIEEAAASWPDEVSEVEIVIDRLVMKPGVVSRLADSVEMALRICGAEVRASVQAPHADHWRELSFQTAWRNPETGFSIDAITPRHFSFHSHLGACTACEGFGVIRTGADAGRICPSCGGRRLKPESLAVRVDGPGSSLGIHEFCQLRVADAHAWIRSIRIEGPRVDACRVLIDDVSKRLEFLADVGLDYLTLDRAAPTLSGGEAQRIRLACQLGAGLSGVLYVLDEPSIGLHAADSARLICALKRLRDGGNTVVVVEHDEAVIRAADHVIDMGPGAGADGGLILAAGAPDALESPTGFWLKSSARRVFFEELSPAGRSLVIRGASEHNLKHIDVEIPLGMLVCLCGPSGSGKSTLADDILRRVLARHFHRGGEIPGAHDRVDGLEHIGKFVVADQSPIGRSPRSNPATFTGVFDVIRGLFARLPLSRQRGYGAARFSFNAGGGRCERCQGNGRLRIEMEFLPDAWIDCPSCGGKRFNRETLEVTWKGRSISDILDMSVDAAASLFQSVPKISRTLGILSDLGLGYLKLGQAGDTLSGGEAQRLKLAVELARPQAPHTLYLFDEPTTGLHFGDVGRLLHALRRLCDTGHSVLVIEHHLDVIAAADWVIELGPGGGESGGSLVCAGPPSVVAACAASATGQAWRGGLADAAAS